MLVVASSSCPFRPPAFNKKVLLENRAGPSPRTAVSYIYDLTADGYTTPRCIFPLCYSSLIEKVSTRVVYGSRGGGILRHPVIKDSI